VAQRFSAAITGSFSASASQIAEKLDFVLGGAAVYRCDKLPIFSAGFSR
jgi:hypothetical protein